MPPSSPFPLRWVDALSLDDPVRAALRPGEFVRDRQERTRRLPRFFYEVTSWEEANQVDITPHFYVAEFLRTDTREAEAVRDFKPFKRYLPCAVVLLAAHLELFRQLVDEPIYLAANGGYRSPGHRSSGVATPHLWGTAANIYKIGDDFVNTRARIEHFRARAMEASPAFWARPYGHAAGEADDHLHLDIGYVNMVPHEAPGEDELLQQLPGGGQAVTEPVEVEAP